MFGIEFGPFYAKKDIVSVSHLFYLSKREVLLKCDLAQSDFSKICSIKNEIFPGFGNSCLMLGEALGRNELLIYQNTG